jgi:23S rRNA (uracil1939-C5)-methyltransferase
MLAQSKVPVIVGVSCNPNTFARDAEILVKGGYRLETLWPVAQFRWSTHVELVARFVR